jgi:hypothetical protein
MNIAAGTFRKRAAGAPAACGRGAERVWANGSTDMSLLVKHPYADARRASAPGCLACGEVRNMGRRRYCSIECRQKLRFTLNMHTGLLRALNTRYATFYFTPKTVILDVLPFGSSEIYSFIYPRSPGRKPAAEFRHMSNMLGTAWWAERKRTNKKYRASQIVFERARRNGNTGNSMAPMEIRIPSVNDRSLIRLQLGKSVLDSPELDKAIKAAYRKQALKHHPDRGGDSAAFRRIHQAYRELIEWAESPTFVRRRGFPDKWFYDGIRNRWVQPTPALA